MRLLVSLALTAQLAAASSFSYNITGDDPGPWPKILSSIGFTASTGGATNLFVVRSSSQATVAQWIERMEKGSFIILEGESDLAEALGIKPTSHRVTVRSILDVHAPKLPIVWEKPLDLPKFEVPKSASVFATERWEGAPVVAGIRRGAGAALWMAVTPGPQGYERFPYLLQSIHDLGLDPPFVSHRLWAFFDSAYRSRVDLDYFADRWRKAGIGTLHVAGWHFYETSPESDKYLHELIAACHRKGILVYVWLELPHVSEKFWADHPEWREKTAILQDAQLDWRKLMNLSNRAAFEAVRQGTQGLIERFDWDGVNLAELYFESLEGVANPARFTPMNDDVRREFKAANGADPIDLLKTEPTKFLEYRADLARRQQTEWIGVIDALRTKKPDLDLVLTHVDDRFDSRMRELVGADAARLLPLLDHHDFTFMIEDPATLWNLGPQRYPEIAKRYQPLTKRTDKLAIDINIVERYQDVYPTKQQTGTELFELVHLAAQAFPQVALYFENSILKPDLTLLSAASASVDKVEQTGSKLTIESHYGVGVPWQGPANVNGHIWPVQDSRTLWLPPGSQTVEPAAKETPLHILEFNGGLKTATAKPNGVEFSYQSNARALATIDFKPASVEVDGALVKLNLIQAGSNYVVQLPKGQHLVTLDQN